MRRAVRDSQKYRRSIARIGNTSIPSIFHQRIVNDISHFLTNACRSCFVQSNPPMAPSALVGKKAMIANIAVRMPHAGCQYSG
jgi:hypothetical protein